MYSEDGDGSGGGEGRGEGTTWGYDLKHIQLQIDNIASNHESKVGVYSVTL